MPDRRKGTNAVPAREQRLEDSSRQFYSVSGFAVGIFRAYVSISYRLAKAYVAWETRSTKKFNTSSSPRSNLGQGWVDLARREYQEGCRRWSLRLTPAARAGEHIFQVTH